MSISKIKICFDLCSDIVLIFLTKFKSLNMPQPSNRAAQHLRWLTTHVIHHTKRRVLLLDAVPGDNRWFDAEPNRLLPTRCRAGVERRQFKHTMRKVAFAYKESHLHNIEALDKIDRPADSGSDSAPQMRKKMIVSHPHNSPASA